MSGATDGWGTKVVSISDLQQQVAAKDAEIERLREALKGLIPILEAVRYTAGLGKNQMARVEKAKALIASETHERAAVLPQDRRSGVSGHGEPPDTPTGDTRG